MAIANRAMAARQQSVPRWPRLAPLEEQRSERPGNFARAFRWRSGGVDLRRPCLRTEILFRKRSRVCAREGVRRNPPICRRAMMRMLELRYVPDADSAPAAWFVAGDCAERWLEALAAAGLAVSETRMFIVPKSLEDPSAAGVL